MRVSFSDIPGKLLISTSNQNTLKLAQAYMDGRKVRGKNQINIPIKASNKLVLFKDVEPITFESDEVKDVVNNVYINVKKKIAKIAEIKKAYADKDFSTYDYDYKGPYPGLMDHQKTMYRIMTEVDCGAILGDPGTGKTLAYIAAIDKRIQKGEVKRALIITLATLKKNVVAEIEQQAPHLKAIAFMSKVHADKVVYKRFNREHNNIDYDIHVCNYELMNTFKDILQDHYYDMVILDEAHRVGAPRTNQTKAVVETFEDVKYKYIATGTLNANSVMSFYMPFRFMGADILPYANYYTYRAQYMKTIDPNGHIWVPKRGAIQETGKLIGKFGVRFAKEDCQDLPEVVFATRTIPMVPDQKRAYKSAKKDMMVVLDGICKTCPMKDECDRKECTNPDASIDSALVLLRKLHQIASGFYMDTKVLIHDDGTEETIKNILDFESNPKLKLLVDTLKSIPPEKKVIIWTTYTHSVEMIQLALKQEFGEHSVITGYGGQDAFEQGERFKEDGVRFLVANTRKMSTGLNLQFSNYQVFFDNSFSLIDRQQAIGRQHREGQKETITVYDLICEETVDEYILEKLNTKAELSLTLSQFAKILKR